MNRAAWIALAAGLVLIGGVFWWLRGAAPEPEPAPGPAAMAELAGATADTAAEPAFPLPEAAVEDHPLLPPLDDSDEAVREAMAGLEEAGAGLVERLVERRLIERFVATVNALDQRQIQPRLLPVRPLPQPPEVDAVGGGRYRFDPINSRRYRAYVQALTAPSVEAQLALYQRYYPLMQQAYDALGESRTPYFNDRFLAILDHLLATPTVASPMLERPKVMYRFADPELEALSAGQKALIRLGPDHAARVRQRLEALRDAIRALAVAQPRPEADSSAGEAAEQLVEPPAEDATPPADQAESQSPD